MNRYAATGLLADAARGKKILVLSGSQAEARQAFREIAASIAEPDREPWQVRFANGREGVRHGSGGWIRCNTITTIGTYGRGMAVDAVFVDEDAVCALRDDRNLNRRAVEEFALMLAASGGAVVQA